MLKADLFFQCYYSLHKDVHSVKNAQKSISTMQGDMKLGLALPRTKVDTILQMSFLR